METAKQLWITHKATWRVWQWGEADLVIWLRDGCRCVYCGRDMLSDRGIAYCLYHYDHLLPVSNPKYSNLSNAIWNKVLACKACNSWKHTFDAAEAGGITPTEDFRDRLIEQARGFIRDRKRDAEALFVKEREILTDALSLWKSD